MAMSNLYNSHHLITALHKGRDDACRRMMDILWNDGSAPPVWYLDLGRLMF